MPCSTSLDTARALGNSARLERLRARRSQPARGAAALAVLALAFWNAMPAHAQTVLYRVNVGGPQLASLDAGPNWGRDDAGSPSPYVNSGAGGNWFGGTDSPMGPPHASVPASVPLAVFDDERWDLGDPPEMQWEFPVANGTYVVNLLLAEGCSCAQSPGSRKMDVACEGTVRLDNYDIVSHFGGYTPGMESFVASVGDGGLSLEFRHTEFNAPSIRGIEIVSVNVSGLLSPSATTVAFGGVRVDSTSPPRQVTVTNLGQSGDPAITITNVAISGPFAHTLSPQTLAPGQSRAFNLTFTPTAAGPDSGVMTITHNGSNSPVTIALSGTGLVTPPVGFGKSDLLAMVPVGPTSLQFGPDGKLYVAQDDGVILRITVLRHGPNQYEAISTELITLVRDIPNHDDDGTLNPSITTRLVTGIVVTGTAANPVIYATSTDPRLEFAHDTGLDTNGGMISRLTWNGSSWSKVDLVRGLPRSEEDHATNGLALDAATNTLYVAQGGNTNMGAPSNNFSFLPEYALSAAILSVDLDAIGNSTYDLPTLNDEDRAGVNDANDPFGGNDGKNQAIIVPGGPVQVHSPGYRNPFDVLFTTNGRLYTIDNGPNAGWGGPPIGEGPGGGCTNADNDNDSFSLSDNLHYIPAAGFYAGHPNPTRATTSNTFNPSNPQSPVPSGDSRQCEYREPGVPVASGGDGALATWNFSTNGLTEYRASNFGGSMTGNLLAATFNNDIQRIVLNAAGDSAVSVSALFSNVGNISLDVTTQGDGEFLPGTIWVCNYGSGLITVFEPSDFEGNQVACTGADDAGLDEDGDGYTNADEIDNSTSPCSAGDLPSDFDADFVSDLNDPDDDNDGIADVADAFAIDASNGALPLPVTYSWDGGAPGFGLLGLGFTGLMVDAVTNYRNMFDPALMTAGGAAGKLTIDAVPAGDARGAQNDQRYAFQFGVAADSTAGPFVVRSRVSSPYFNGASPSGAQSFGIFMGDGGDDDYLKLTVTGDAGQPALEVVHEVGGVVSATLLPVPGLLAGNGIGLALEVNPAAATVQPRYAIGNAPFGNAGPLIALVPGSALHAAVTAAPPLAVGIIGTSRGASPFTATWDFFDVDNGSTVDVAPAARLTGAPRFIEAWPNPARGSAALRFELPYASLVRLALYDVSGARVRTLEHGWRPAGSHTVHWDGRDDRGREVPAGIYFHRLEVGPHRVTQRVAMVR